MNQRNQQGAALITALIFLVILTLVAVSSVQNVNLQERMSSSVRQGYVALEVSESGLRDAEQYLKTNFTTLGAFTVQNNPGLYDKGDAPNPWSLDWTDDTLVRAATPIELDGKEYTPHYFIERIGPMVDQFDTGEISTGGVQNALGENIGFRIVARGVGGDGVTERIVETYVARLF